MGWTASVCFRKQKKECSAMHSKTLDNPTQHFHVDVKLMNSETCSTSQRRLMSPNHHFLKMVSQVGSKRLQSSTAPRGGARWVQCAPGAVGAAACQQSCEGGWWPLRRAHGSGLVGGLPQVPEKIAMPLTAHPPTQNSCSRRIP